MTLGTRLVEVPVLPPEQQARAEALVRSENRVINAAIDWFATWANRPDDVPPGADLALYEAIAALVTVRES